MLIMSNVTLDTRDHVVATLRRCNTPVTNCYLYVPRLLECLCHAQERAIEVEEFNLAFSAHRETDVCAAVEGEKQHLLDLRVTKFQFIAGARLSAGMQLVS
jgi:hypothetical protein